MIERSIHFIIFCLGLFYSYCTDVCGGAVPTLGGIVVLHGVSCCLFFLYSHFDYRFSIKFPNSIYSSKPNVVF